MFQVRQDLTGGGGEQDAGRKMLHAAGGFRAGWPPGRHERPGHRGEHREGHQQSGTSQI